ncbi:hypothetical protein V500_05648 [Pseudogymnoascus sp. VKM F-4518 (FW-2643)]|nr:hypothetical protein V500_05648 [Pseudogymnoascus sp. VKM F-4518 (FW-2643)]
MDLFYFDSTYAVLACLPCQYAVVPGTIASHLRAHHKDEVTREQIQYCVKYYAAQLIQSAAVIQKLRIPRQTSPISYLILYSNGIACRLCPDVQPYICGCEKAMREHLKDAHQWQSGSKGGRPKKSPSSTKSVARELWAKVTVEPVYYQTFHQSNFLRYFQVNPPALAASSSSPLSHLSSAPRPMTVRERVEQQLARKLQARDQAAAFAGLQAQHATEVSPWLETTRWGDYFAGKSLQAAAHLIDLPTERRVIVAADTNSTFGLSYNAIEERQLALLLISFDRLIKQARESLAEEKINIFDQHKVTASFAAGLTSARCLPSSNRGHCVQAREKGELEFFGLRDLDSNQGEEVEAITMEEENDISLDALYQSLDQACLQFCITLLDHCLMGKIYDSIVLGFIAVLSINEGRDGFHNACNFTSKLSAFIKMAQLLVLQRAVVAAECGETQFPSEALDEMQDRFMVLESRSPMNWALKLQAYRKKIRESTTCLGSLIWSVDGEKLSYVDLELTMSQLWYFVCFQLNRAQNQLEEVLLVHPTEACEQVVPPINLKDLKDNPAIRARAVAIKLSARGRPASGQVLKAREVADRCHSRVQEAGRRFSRAIAITLLQYNPWLTEDVLGLVNIIHRYLPAEISELVVYYLWLVLPFCQQLDLLGSDISAQPSAFLWALPQKAGPWPSSQLSSVLQGEFERHLKTKANIRVWRHAAIAISQKHLQQGKFKKDYRVNSTATWADAQSAHGSLRAGLAYARALEEAPGHVEAARSEYRALSQEWHSFLGFGAYLGRRDRQVMVSPATGAPILQLLHVRKRSYSTIEEGSNKENESVFSRPLDIEAEIQRRVKEELL